MGVQSLKRPTQPFQICCLAKAPKKEPHLKGRIPSPRNGVAASKHLVGILKFDSRLKKTWSLLTDEVTCFWIHMLTGGSCGMAVWVWKNPGIADAFLASITLALQTTKNAWNRTSRILFSSCLFLPFEHGENHISIL